MRGARRRQSAEGRVAVVRKIPCMVARRDRSRRTRLHRGARAGTAVPRFRPGQFLHLALDAYEPGRLLAGVARVLDRQLAGRSGSAHDHLCGQGSVHDADGARAGRGRRRLGQAALRRVRGRSAAPMPCCSRAAPASRRSRRSCSRSSRGGRRASCSSTAPARPTSSCTDPSPRACARRAPALTCNLVCEQTHGRLAVDAAWPAIGTLVDPVFYLSGPPQMLAALTAQLRGHGVAPDDIRTDAWE